jgi:hypothetical protein
MKVQTTNKTKKASKLSFARKLGRSKAKMATKLSESEKIETQDFFEENFVKDDYEYLPVTFTSEDLPLIEYMKSSEINSNNRQKVADNVARLFRCLKAGIWYQENLDIHVAKEGHLMNGQHTLEAVAQFFLDANTPSGSEVPIGFKIGCNEDAMPYLDTQKKRTPEQNLMIENVLLNPTQKAIVLIEGKRVIHGKPFGYSGQVNYFEYEDIIEDNKSILTDVFKDRVLSRDFPHKSIGYALFLLAKENQELAEDIMNEICDSHSMENRGKSFADPKQLEEHLLVEMYRREKRDKIDTMSSKTNRDCYRQEEFFPIAVDWLVSNHNIDRKVFKA